ncbi:MULTISPECIES: hypothetical protein [Bacillus]|uniref:YfhS protein n=1 Tax=Bacillus glycinifermentans TaxID=1664069 RepID=A0AAJ4D1Y7_9BACI|nr:MULTISPECIES: hypothetical protein [Bacillus]KKB73589.1 hypothetical protein TH62_11345 [Bacillus sp. TH008]MBU8786775.1 hypothetical protein [Bacillus glycinifermentans]MDU0072465.1 hypothetical protein [Bacillus sp. IG6]MED8020258.1 hypothetical protein [Bacillus glycinifermentans]NUJ18231.1 hypothetical protein [Bacillus glycinifermentans]
MYVGRDMSELDQTPKHEWKDAELLYFHHAFQQMMPFLNEEGHAEYVEVVKEIKTRGGLSRREADYTHGTDIQYD